SDDWWLQSTRALLNGTTTSVGGNRVQREYPDIKQDIKSCRGIINRLGSTGPFYDRLEQEGAVSLNSQEAVNTSDSKILSQRCFEREGVPTPKTVCFPSSHTDPVLREAITEVPGPPYVVKSEFGRLGEQVFFPETESEALELINARIRDGQGALIQEQVTPTDAYIRAVVLNGEVIAAKR